MAIAPALASFDPLIATPERRLELLRNRSLDRPPDLQVDQLAQRRPLTLNDPQLLGTISHGAFLPPPWQAATWWLFLHRKNAPFSFPHDSGRDLLILDKSLARQAQTIAFFKIDNDGFGLGAQRREIEKNDLPQARAEIAEYLRRLRARESVEDFQPALGLVVPKEKIAATGDYNLSGERYREGAAQSTHFPWRTIESLVETITPPAKIQKTAFGQVGRFPIIDQSQDDIAGWTDDESTLIRPIKPLVIFGDHTCAVKIVYKPFAQGADGIKILQTIDALDPRFLFQVLRARPLESDGYQRHYSKLKEHQIPLPPLEMQKEIVAEIVGYQQVIDGARGVLDNYRPHIPVHPDWPTVPIKQVAAVESGYGFPLDYQGKTDEEIPFLKVSDMNLPGNETRIVCWNNTVSREVLRELKARAFPVGTVIFPKIGAAIATNKKRILTRDSTYDNNVMGIVPDTERLLPDFLHTYLLAFDLSRWASESQPPSMRKTTVEAHEIPLPALATQQAIVAEIEAEQALVAANRQLIARFEKKIHATLARVWGEDEPAPAEA